MKRIIWIILLFAAVSACRENPNDGKDKDKDKDKPTEEATALAYEISVEKVATSVKTPALQSAVWAEHAGEVVFLGGRKDGFHGRTLIPPPFLTTQANDSLWVYNFQEQKVWKSAIKTTNAEVALQLQASNMAFCQSGDTLFMIGGYGYKPPLTTQKPQSNFTFDAMVMFSVSKLIDAIKKQEDITPSILAHIKSPYLQVTGGELVKIGDYFYLAFGQNYNTVYSHGKNGIYTDAIKRFKLEKGALADTTAYTDVQKTGQYHRRDLNVLPFMQQGRQGLVSLGGVFTKDDNGWVNPIVLTHSANAPTIEIREDFAQKTNQYTCAAISMYAGKQNVMSYVLLGGIGQNQYNPKTKQWENGDNGAKLPFVKSITQLQFAADGNITEFVQGAPAGDALPAFLGANALFIPTVAMTNFAGIIDYDKLPATSEPQMIGYFMGGILATAATSDAANPTKTNPDIYKVFLKKLKLAPKENLN